MISNEEYKERESLLAECRSLAESVYGSVDLAEKWLMTKSDSFWNMSPMECISNGKGEEVKRILIEKFNQL